MTKINKRKPKDYHQEPIVTVINLETKTKTPFHDFEEAEHHIETHETPWLLDCDFSKFYKNMIAGKNLQ